MKFHWYVLIVFILIINNDGTQLWLFYPNNPDQGSHIDGYDYSFLEVE